MYSVLCFIQITLEPPQPTQDVLENVALLRLTPDSQEKVPVR